MKVIIDVNLTRLWVSHFREAQIEARYWEEVGPPDAADSEILQWATEHQYTILTADVDFSTLLATLNLSAPSVILLRTSSQLPERIATQLIQAIRAFADDLESGCILTLDNRHARIRSLPVR